MMFRAMIGIRVTRGKRRKGGGLIRAGLGLWNSLACLFIIVNDHHGLEIRPSYLPLVDSGCRVGSAGQALNGLDCSAVLVRCFNYRPSRLEITGCFVNPADSFRLSALSSLPFSSRHLPHSLSSLASDNVNVDPSSTRSPPPSPTQLRPPASRPRAGGDRARWRRKRRA
jgi:hypothetical protein